MAAALLLAAAPVSAQDMVYSDAGTLACLAAAASTSAKAECAGVSALACMEDSPGGTSTMGNVECLDSEVTFWDDILAGLRAQAMEKARATDEAARTDGLGQSFMVETLTGLETAWQGYSDARCAFERAQYRDGTGGGPAELRCVLRTMGEHAAYLQDMWISQ
ncbi:lysozyme inhibitor LprI family protein [Seohaeicola zhoushanensis]|uniref:Lysozyme inhibitor LprI-like N-terminal domain-containing protein n=1 Tax=Seohaeicola zhoushanensis TaxID=1569283 RepID=A0A8J3M6H6_9RHOB|nr:lysozyme inhibitor LprI family protein [Seohaeicola zhoushanensis]GHF47490.1 hypothetical protein GCM10017056_19100 [Seohaeicola zhoushanensis]